VHLQGGLRRRSVVEHNGDFYCCDHFTDAEHRLGSIHQTPLAELLDSPAQQEFGRAKRDTLPHCCQVCEVRAMCNGECPKNRFLQTPDGEPGLNYLCAGLQRFFIYCSRSWPRSRLVAAAATAGETGRDAEPPSRIGATTLVPAAAAASTRIAACGGDASFGVPPSGGSTVRLKDLEHHRHRKAGGGHDGIRRLKAELQAAA